MKIKELLRHMNDHGTNPHVKIIKRNKWNMKTVYYGAPDTVDDEINQLKVNSFIVIRRGQLEIYCE